MGQAALVRVRQKYNETVYYEELIKIYQAAMAGLPEITAPGRDRT